MHNNLISLSISLKLKVVVNNSKGKNMEEFVEELMRCWIINDNGELEYSIKKVIESWNMSELETLLNTNKGV